MNGWIWFAIGASAVFLACLGVAAAMAASRGDRRRGGGR